MFPTLNNVFIEACELTRGLSEVMLRARDKKVKGGEKVRAFQEALFQLYQKFEADVDALCKKQDIKINCWYSPSTIPQPKFVIDGVTLDADYLYNQKETSKPIQQEKKR